MPESIRTRRVASLLKSEISSIIANDIHDPRVNCIVITQVKVTKDLSLAKIYYSSYDKNLLKDIEIGLGKSKGFIRKKLMEKVHLKKLPSLQFEKDEIPEHADRLDQILKNLKKPDSEVDSE